MLPPPTELYGPWKNFHATEYDLQTKNKPTTTTKTSLLIFFNIITTRLYFPTVERIILFPPGPTPFWFLGPIPGITSCWKTALKHEGTTRLYYLNTFHSIVFDCVTKCPHIGYQKCLAILGVTPSRNHMSTELILMNYNLRSIVEICRHSCMKSSPLGGGVFVRVPP